MSENNLRYKLHEAVFKNDLKKVDDCLAVSHDVGQKDAHGNTPLHLAVMKGHKECVRLLLAHNAPVHVANKLGWSPLDEAISYGDRQTILSLIRKTIFRWRKSMKVWWPDLTLALSQIGDFYMELKWDLQSWVPLVSRMFPSDIYRIYKKGSNIRLDTTTWDISFLFMADAKPSQSLVALDNNLKVFQKLRYEEIEEDLEDKVVDFLMSSDLKAQKFSTESFTFKRAHGGWLCREDKTETIGHFLADVYTVNELYLESRRREHLTDLHKNNAELQRRESLPPPKVKPIPWEEYINSNDPSIHIGRPMVCKQTREHFKATLAMSEDFPFSVESLLNFLEVFVPFEHFKKLRDFVQMELPVGFPIKIGIPIFPTMTACIKIQDFQFDVEIPDSDFEVPPDYTEDPTYPTWLFNIFPQI